MFCSCQNISFTEGNILYDFGAESVEDIEKCEFLYEEYQSSPEDKLEITDSEDIAILRHYNYVSDWPTEKFHEILIFPSDTITITINEKVYSFYLNDDGSLTSIPGVNISSAKTYQADKKYRLTPQKFQEWISKYK